MRGRRQRGRTLRRDRPPVAQPETIAIMCANFPADNCIRMSPYLFLVEDVKLGSVLELERLMRWETVVPDVVCVEEVRWDVPMSHKTNN